MRKVVDIGYGGSSSSSGMLGSLASMFNIFTPQATPRYPSARKRPAPETEEPQMHRAKSEPRSRASAKSFSVGSAVAVPVKPESVKVGSVKNERPKSEPGDGVPNLYYTKAESVKAGSAKKAGSVKSNKSSASGSAAQRAGMMALPVGNEPLEGPSPGGSTTSSARLRRAGIKTPTELRSSSKYATSRTSSLNDVQIGPVMAVPMSGSRQPSVVSVHSSRKSAT